MNEYDIKGILWVLKEIEKDDIIRSYFQHNLNLMSTDLAKLIKWFRDMAKINEDSPFEIPLHTIKEKR